ncbi:hypothetical protein ACFYMX_16185 [Streptomyces griseofuscus]|uniref:hypothetical protein n=1 Tax=Streptomyces griseofuscus TaxID=146922 RepID=UPI003674CAB1
MPTSTTRRSRAQPGLIGGGDTPYLSTAYERPSAIAQTAFAPFSESSSWSAYPQATAGFVNGTAHRTRLTQK